MQIRDQQAHLGKDKVELRHVAVLNPQIDPLVQEADNEGHRFMARLRDEWTDGVNRFDKEGEFLLAAFLDDRLVGVGGLNRDPYSNEDRIGHLRHLYVIADARRLGVGTLLVQRIMLGAASTFSALRLRTMTAEAAAFYSRLSFRETDEEAATHITILSTVSRRI